MLVANTHALRGHLRRLGVAFGVIAAFVGWGAVGAPAALAGAAHIYWSNAYGTTIGRSSPEGSEVDDELIKGASVPEGLTVVGQDVFWANEGGTTIGRASLEGTEVDQEFITGADQPSGLASYGGRLYWANLEANTIAEANLDGGEVDQEFIKGASEPAGVAVGGQYVYWSNFQTGAIGRANLQGTEVDQEFIKVLGEPDGLAVNGQYVYWSNFQTGAIGRANLDGGEVDQELIKGGRGPDGVAVDAQNIYWSNLQGDTIGRASLQGTEVDQEFITGVVGPGGLALAPAQPVALAAPSSGGVYAVGESVPTAFLCSEGALEPGLASCDDSNAIDTSTGGSGKLNTSTLGPHSYSVTASSTDGQSGLASIAYTVAAPPSVSISSPASGQVYTQGQLVTTKFACTEGSYGSGLASCNDSNAAATASGGSGHLSTAALGAHTYTVSALSKDAQSAGRIIAYTVVVAPKAAIETSRARVTNANMKLRVACRGATPSIACHGTLSLTIEVKRLVRRRVHGHLRTVPVTTTVVLAHKSYALPHGKQQTFALHLGKTGLEMLEHAPSHVLRVRARATVTDGDGTSRSISLER